MPNIRVFVQTVISGHSCVSLISIDQRDYNLHDGRFKCPSEELSAGYDLYRFIAETLSHSATHPTLHQGILKPAGNDLPEMASIYPQLKAYCNVDLKKKT